MVPKCPVLKQEKNPKDYSRVSTQVNSASGQINIATYDYFHMAAVSIWIILVVS